MPPELVIVTCTVPENPDIDGVVPDALTAVKVSVLALKVEGAVTTSA